MTRRNVDSVIVFAFGLGIMLVAARVATQQTPPGTSVQIVVSVESRRGGETANGTREDVVVTEGHDRDKVTAWVPATGEHAGLDLYVLIDDSASFGVATQLGELRAFIMQQPASTFIALGYMHNGMVQTLQNLTQDHAAAAKAVRLPLGNSVGAASPYFSLQELLKHWQPNPARPRREIVMITNGVDLYSPGPVDPYLDDAIAQVQRVGILVYSIYAQGAGHLGHSFWRNNWGMNNLSQLSDEAGAESYGFAIAPVAFFKPYFDDISNRLAHQYLLTFLAKPEKKAGMQSVRVTTELPNVELVSAHRVYVPASPLP
jgi:hypothetical protein